MDGFTFDFANSDGATTLPPITEAVGGTTNFTNKLNALYGINVGNMESPATGYDFPLTIGTNEYVLSADTGTNSLVWVPNGSGGDIVNGGQAGPVTIGTLDHTACSLISGGIINIGQVGTPDHILMNGSIAFQYDEITSGGPIFTLTAEHYFINVTTSGVNEVKLPDSVSAAGRQYIISKGYSGGTMNVTTTGGDLVDTVSTIPLSMLNQRITVISNSNGVWIIV